MRRKLLRSALLLTIVAVATLGIPLLVLARHEVYSQAQEELRQQTANIATGVEDNLDAGLPADLGRFSANGRRFISVRRADGTVVATGHPIQGPRQQATEQVAGATITLTVSGKPERERAREATALVLALATVAISFGVILSARQARHLSEPLATLAGRAHRIGRDEGAGAPLLSGLEEIDGISAVLDNTAQQVGTLLSLQRQFASDAAHQLRTPLTGIGLRLDEIARLGNADVKTEADDALAQVARLNQVISSLLTRARGENSEQLPVDISAVAQQESSGWFPIFSRSDRRLQLRLTSRSIALTRPDRVATILSVLLDNALHHGAGEVTISVSHADPGIELTVSDNGRGVPAHLRNKLFQRSISGVRGSGIGLALAHALAVGEGADLVLDAGLPTTFRLKLPHAPNHDALATAQMPQELEARQS